jgi:hypothetical protein
MAQELDGRRDGPSSPRVLHAGPRKVRVAFRRSEATLRGPGGLIRRTEPTRVQGESLGGERAHGDHGEIESTIAIGHRFDHAYVLGNVAYGQDPEGNERDGEIRASVLHEAGRLVLGVESRARSAIGAQHGMNSALEPRFDALVGPTALLAIGTFVGFAEVGPSAVRLPGADMTCGVASVAGLASVF